MARWMNYGKKQNLPSLAQTALERGHIIETLLNLIIKQAKFTVQLRFDSHHKRVIYITREVEGYTF